MSWRLKMGASADLLRRTAAVWRHAWRERKTRRSPPRSADEVDFLPAALALQERAVSPAPRVAGGLIVGFALLALAWAIGGEIDIVASAPGQIIPSSRTKLIQPLETVIVRAIHVADGQQVEPGEVLVELDATAPQADSERLAGELVAARAQAARARALLDALEHGAAPRIAAIEGASEPRLAREQRLVDSQYGELQARLARLDADLTRREAERRSTQEIVRKLEQTVPIARQRAQDLRHLAAAEFVSRHGYLEKEQLRLEQEGELATQRSRLHEIAAAIHEGQQQRRALLAESRRQALDSLDDGERKAAALVQERLKAEARGQAMTLTAPVAGTVQQLAVHTVGGVVTPAQGLMAIVPSDEAVEVEAFVDNKDIGFIHAGQEAQVKIETFPFTRYGTVAATVTQVSSDAIRQEKPGRDHGALVYALRARLSQATLRVEEKWLRLSPGMAVTVEIKTGQRRVIEYFLNPLLQYGQESLRER